MDEYRNQSEFNMSFSTFARLHIILLECDESARTLDYHSWYHNILVLYRELSPEMNEEETKNTEKQILILSKYINNLTAQNNRYNKNSLPSSVYNSLHRLEISLRKVMKKTGMYLKDQDDARFALK